MKIDFAPELDSAYLQLDDAKIIESEKVLSGVAKGVNSHGGVVGVEILGVKRKKIRYLIKSKDSIS